MCILFSWTKCCKFICITPHKPELESAFIFPQKDLNLDPITALKSSLIDEDEALGIRISWEGCGPEVVEDPMEWDCSTGQEMGRSVTVRGSVLLWSPYNCKMQLRAGQRPGGCAGQLVVS